MLTKWVMGPEDGPSTPDVRPRSRGKAFEALYDRWGPRARRVVQQILGRSADADDVVQEVFLRIHRALPERGRRTGTGRRVLQLARALALEHKARRSARRESPRGVVPAVEVADRRWSVDPPSAVEVTAA